MSLYLSIFLLTLIACPTGSQQLSVIKEITLKELQIGHLSDVWSDLTETDSQLSPLQLPLSAIFSVISGQSICQEVLK